MKMLFFSADGSEIDVVNRELVSAGIACEIRNRPQPGAGSRSISSAELWVHHEQDCYRASLLCVELGVGFFVRPARRPARLWTVLDSPERQRAA
jgi:hypothetical protein